MTKLVGRTYEPTGEHQAGFSKRKSTADVIQMMTRIHELANSCGKRVNVEIVNDMNANVWAHAIFVY